MAVETTELSNYSPPRATPSSEKREDTTLKGYRNRLLATGLGETTKDVLFANGLESETAEARAFNRFNWIMPSDEISNLLSYVFIVRPDLNVIKSDDGTNLQISDSLMNDPYFQMVAAKNPSVLRNLCHNSAGFNHDFISFLVNRVETYDIPDWSVSAKDISMPFTNYKIQYAGNANDSISARNFEIEFREDANLRVTKLFTAWTKYINGVVMNIYETRHEYQQSRFIDGAPILDYATSIYLIKTKPDGSEIVYFHKTTGGFPVSVPHNKWSYNKDGSVNRTIDISFYGGFPEPLNPETLSEFNYNAGFSANKGSPSGYADNYDIAHWASPLVGRPFIVEDKYGKIRLCWEPLH